jgi:hypothetical protein
MQMKLNVHELIDMPGYGKANVAVQKAGKWDFGPIERLEHAALVATTTGETKLADLIEDAVEQLKALRENQQ